MGSAEESVLVRGSRAGDFWWLAGLAVLATGLVSFAPTYAWWGVLLAILAVFTASFVLFRRLSFGINRPRALPHQNRLLVVGHLVCTFSILWLFLFAPPPAWLFLVCVAGTFIPFMLLAFSVERRDGRA